MNPTMSQQTDKGWPTISNSSIRIPGREKMKKYFFPGKVKKLLQRKRQAPIKFCHLSINELHTSFVLLSTRCLTLLCDSYLVRLYGLSVPPHQIHMHPQTPIALGYKSHSLYGALYCSVQHWDTPSLISVRNANEKLTSSGLRCERGQPSCHIIKIHCFDEHFSSRIRALCCFSGRDGEQTRCSRSDI